MKAYRGSRRITPIIPNLVTRWRRVVNFAQCLLTPKREESQYLLNLGGLQSLSGRFCMFTPDRTGEDRTEQDRTGQDRTGQERTGKDKTGQDRKGQERTRQDRRRQDRAGQDRTEQNRTGQTRRGQDRIGEDRTGPVFLAANSSWFINQLYVVMYTEERRKIN
jgi:hypothetical protein